MATIDLSRLVTAEIKAAEALATTMASYQRTIQALIDATAISRKYSDGNALAGYVASTIAAWASEAQAFVAWRDAVWLHAYTELDKVMTGQRPQPTVEAFVGELPVIEWPD